MNLLCKIGMHRYKKRGSYTHFTSNIKDVRYECSRCGKTKNNIVIKRD